jgi:hypothetical protein
VSNSSCVLPSTFPWQPCVGRQHVELAGEHQHEDPIGRRGGLGGGIWEKEEEDSSLVFLIFDIYFFTGFTLTYIVLYIRPTAWMVHIHGLEPIHGTQAVPATLRPKAHTQVLTLAPLLSSSWPSSPYDVDQITWWRMNTCMSLSRRPGL